MLYEIESSATGGELAEESYSQQCQGGTMITFVQQCQGRTAIIFSCFLCFFTISSLFQYGDMTDGIALFGSAWFPWNST